jgi:glycerol uptake facilitator protein
VSLALIFLSEAVGSTLLMLLGCGVVANVALAKTKGNSAGTLFVNWGWGIAVLAGVVASAASGSQLNFAVTMGVVASGAKEFVPGVPVNIVSILTYFGGQMVGSIIGAVLCWVAYKQHFDDEPDPATKLGVFSTGPQIRSYGWNLATEAVATFVLVFFIMALSDWATKAGIGWLGALPVPLLVVGIGASLGGPTGYAINPNRDLGPRIAHAFLPIKGKGSSDWAYSWVPVLGPIIGGVLAGWSSNFLLHLH